VCHIVSEFDGASQERVQTCIVRGQTETVPRWRTVDQLADHRGMENVFQRLTGKAMASQHPGVKQTRIVSSR